MYSYLIACKVQLFKYNMYSYLSTVSAVNKYLSFTLLYYGHFLFDKKNRKENIRESFGRTIFPFINFFALIDWRVIQNSKIIPSIKFWRKKLYAKILP